MFLVIKRFSTGILKFMTLNLFFCMYEDESIYIANVCFPDIICTLCVYCLSANGIICMLVVEVVSVCLGHDHSVAAIARWQVCCKSVHERNNVQLCGFCGLRTIHRRSAS